MITQNIRIAFPQLQDARLYQAIADHSMTATFSAEETIMDYGRNITFMPLIMNGGLRILRKNENGDEVFLYFLSAGDTCAMSLTCCMDRAVSEVKAIAEEDSTLLMIPVEKMETWMVEFPTWKRFVMQTYRSRFNELLKTIDSIAFENLDVRLFNYLQEKTRHAKVSTLEITHQTIATELNSSREAISRLLKKLEIQEKIKLGRNRISLINS